jgi:hypothetical protein
MTNTQWMEAIRVVIEGSITIGGHIYPALITLRLINKILGVI